LQFLPTLALFQLWENVVGSAESEDLRFWRHPLLFQKWSKMTNIFKYKTIYFPQHPYFLIIGRTRAQPNLGG